MDHQLDYFDRQKRIPGWNQQLIESQVCFCLGAGGLGCTVALDLVRLGNLCNQDQYSLQIKRSKKDFHTGQRYSRSSQS